MAGYHSHRSGTSRSERPVVASYCPYTPLPRLRQLLLEDYVPAATLGQVGSVVHLPTRDTMENQVGGGSVKRT